MSYQQYLRSRMKVIGGPLWDRLISDIAADFAALKEAKAAQEILADKLLARGLDVIEQLVSPIALLAGQRVAQIDELITEGTESVNNFVANGEAQVATVVGNATTAADNIAAILAELQGDGVPADLVIESATRVFVTPEQKAAFVGYAAAIALLAPIASPAFTGNPTAPTQTAGDNSTKLATTQFVTAAIAAIVNSSPAALDTLKELADALGDDPNFATTMATALGNRLRVDISTQGLTGTQQGNALTNLGYSTFGKTLIALVDAAALRTAAGLGTAALANTGTAAGQVPVLATGGKYPALDGSLITNLADTGLVSVDFYTSSQTITIKGTRAFVEMVGPGGGSSGASDNASNSSLPGGGGSWLEKMLTGLTVGSTLVYTQGASGTAGAAAGGSTRAGGAGGSSTLASGTQTIATLTCPGGKGAPSTNAALGPSLTYSTDFSAVAAGGDVNDVGSPGLLADPGATGWYVGVISGEASGWGRGARGRVSADGQGAGFAGNGFGSGGGSSFYSNAAQVGRAGQPGALRIWWFK